jgi:hypothetical protein
MHSLVHLTRDFCWLWASNVRFAACERHFISGIGRTTFRPMGSTPPEQPALQRNRGRARNGIRKSILTLTANLRLEPASVSSQNAQRREKSRSLMPRCQATTTVESSSSGATAQTPSEFARYDWCLSGGWPRAIATPPWDTTTNATGYPMLVIIFDPLQLLREPYDRVTIVPRAKAFGGAAQDLAQPIPRAVSIIDPHES